MIKTRGGSNPDTSGRGYGRYMLVFLGIAITLSVFAPKAYAYRRYYRPRGVVVTPRGRVVVRGPRYPHYPGRLLYPPYPAARIVVRGAPYYYGSGEYYREIDGEYVIVSAPLGAVVATLPSGHRVVVVRGRSYYCYGSVYYLRGPGGYVVVRDPYHNDRDVYYD